MGIYVYLADMPTKVKGVTVPCDDGYTIYINNKLTKEQQGQTIDHEMYHINNGDFEKFDISQIEKDCKNGTEKKTY